MSTFGDSAATLCPSCFVGPVSGPAFPGGFGDPLPPGRAHLALRFPARLLRQRPGGLLGFRPALSLGSTDPAPGGGTHRTLWLRSARSVRTPRLAAQFSGDLGNSFRKDLVLVPVADQGGLQQFCVRVSRIGQ